MLTVRPFKVGDFVSVGGVVGTVRELGLFGTTMVTPDHVMTTVGNENMFDYIIQNFSVLPVCRIERVAQLANGVDPLDAIARLKAAVAKIPNVSTSMPPEVNLLDMKLEGPQISVRPYTHTDQYRQVYFDTNEAIVRVCVERLAGAGKHADPPKRGGLIQVALTPARRWCSLPGRARSLSCSPPRSGA